MVLSRDRWVVLACAVLLCGTAWIYLFTQASAMQGMEGLAMPQMRAWDAGDLGFLFVMWSVMMVAMMLPSAAPALHLFASLNHRRKDARRRSVPSVFFLAGYLGAWTLFSAVASLTQWLLHRGALLSPGMVSTNTVLAGGILITAGLFQWTPLKNTCIQSCRSPLSFLTRHWREGVGGALKMGFHHGFYCVGCCWALMALLFVGGVMNLLWVAALALLVLVEKTLPHGDRVARVAGVLLVGWGLALIAGPLLYPGRLPL